MHRAANRTARRAAGGEANLKNPVDVILTTDAMSRGMDFQRVSHIINFEVPTTSSNYLHRAGRVGRLMGNDTGLRSQQSVVVTMLQANSPFTADHQERLRKLSDILNFKLRRSAVNLLVQLYGNYLLFVLPPQDHADRERVETNCCQTMNC